MDAKEFAAAYGEAFGPAAGLPLLFWLAIGALVAVIIVLIIAYRWGVH